MRCHCSQVPSTVRSESAVTTGSCLPVVGVLYSMDALSPVSLCRFLRTGTARLLDSSRFLVARSSDATIFPIRFRLFETPPSSKDLRPKLTGIIGAVNSDEGFIIVGDRSLEFVVTAACGRSCDLIGFSGHEIEHGAATGVELFPELFASVEEEGRPALGMHLRHRRPGARSVAHGPGSVAHGGASVAHRSRVRADKSQGLEGVPEWAMEMPRRLQQSFSKPTRVHMFPSRSALRGLRSNAFCLPLSASPLTTCLIGTRCVGHAVCRAGNAGAGRRPAGRWREHSSACHCRHGPQVSPPPAIRRAGPARWPALRRRSWCWQSRPARRCSARVASAPQARGHSYDGALLCHAKAGAQRPCWGACMLDSAGSAQQAARRCQPQAKGPGAHRSIGALSAVLQP